MVAQTETKKQRRPYTELRWRDKAVYYLKKAGFAQEAESFRTCGDLERGFRVEICESNPVEHQPKACPETCHLRICPDCERRAQAKRLARYQPAIEESVALNIPGYSLKKFELTTPLSLSSCTPESLSQMWDAVTWTLNRVLFEELESKNRLSAAEVRRGRVDLKKHNIGALICCEFGERGQKLHFHILIYSCFISKDRLTNTWKAATNGAAKITWIKKIENDSVRDAVQEVAKYVTKFNELPARLVPVLLTVLSGSRRLRSFGAWHGLPKEQKHQCTCSTCGAARRLVELSTFMTVASHDDKKAALTVRDAYGNLFYLDLKHGNKSGETIVIGIKPLPTAYQPGLWDVPKFDLKE